MHGKKVYYGYFKLTEACEISAVSISLIEICG